MQRCISPIAGMPATDSSLIDPDKLLDAYSDTRPDPAIPEQRVGFGTSGHRGSALSASFNEWHILAITQAIADYRKSRGIDGPLYLGMDTHALSKPAFDTALEVLAGNGVDTVVAVEGAFTPTPVISHAILSHNRKYSTTQADGVVITPSHNPPEYGGIKYNPPHGGPAETPVTTWIETRANALLQSGLKGVKRILSGKGRSAATTHECDFATAYIDDLNSVIDFDIIRDAGLRIGIDPLGGAGTHYWQPIASRYGLNIATISDIIDPTFSFMSLDWDGKIRMDPSSKYAMQRLIGRKDDFDIALACDTDYDRHGIVTKSNGLLKPNHYLSVAVDYLLHNRKKWNSAASIGKTLVTTSLLDRICTGFSRRIYEVPVGFKWFVEGLFSGALGVAVEESAGAAFLRRDGSTWTTDKDGIVSALLSAEILARTGKDPGILYKALTQEIGAPVSDRIDAPATVQQKAKLATLSLEQVSIRSLAGEKVEQILDRAPGNHAFLDGIKVIAANGWFAARPSGTENIYKIYAESFLGETHLRQILTEAQQLVDSVLAEPGQIAIRHKG